MKKYLDVMILLNIWVFYIDEKLTWSAHINKLSLQLAKHNARMYQICDYANSHTLNMLYYSFVYSSLNYSIIVWSTASQNQLHEINVKMNNNVCILTWNKKFSHVTHFIKK